MGPQDLLDALDEIVYVSDPNTYELLYANRRCRSLLPTRDYARHSVRRLAQAVMELYSERADTKIF